jgi:hypothetical protein
MVIAFGKLDNLVCWKTAFDETFARYSPGLLLLSSVTDAWLADPTFAFADSCAGPDNSTPDRLWTDRIRVGDLFVAVSPRSLGFRIVDARERIRRSLRRVAKAAYRAAVDRRR